jgi:hypothetical protein
LPPILFVSDMLCLRYFLSPMRYAADTLHRRYVLSPIRFGLIRFVPVRFVHVPINAVVNESQSNFTSYVNFVIWCTHFFTPRPSSNDCKSTSRCSNVRYPVEIYFSHNHTYLHTVANTAYKVTYQIKSLVCACTHLTCSGNKLHLNELTYLG